MPVSTATPVPILVQDPRNTITEESFRIDPNLLGTPLARPWRRAAAMAIDGVLIGILANAPSVLFGIAAALVLLRVSARPAQGGYVRRSVRLMLRFWTAVVVFAVVLWTWSEAKDLGESWFGDESAEQGAGGARAPSAPALTGIRGLGVAAEAVALTRADDEQEARTLAERLVRDLRAAGMPEREIHEMLQGLGSTPGKPWMAGVTDSILRSMDVSARQRMGAEDSLVLAFAGALSSGDTAAAAELRARVAAVVAADTIQELRQELREEERRREALQERLEAQQRRFGVMSVLRSAADDLGFGFGWTGLYFTACLALFNGATPGKRLLRMRVIRLDGRPLGWWGSFERFGGYAASIATGLLGFLQILWDRNRQGIHDKIAETVVIES